MSRVHLDVAGSRCENGLTTLKELHFTILRAHRQTRQHQFAAGAAMADRRFAFFARGASGNARRTLSRRRWFART
jgi:hypothetical protein